MRIYEATTPDARIYGKCVRHIYTPHGRVTEALLIIDTWLKSCENSNGYQMNAVKRLLMYVVPTRPLWASQRQDKDTDLLWNYEGMEKRQAGREGEGKEEVVAR